MFFGSRPFKTIFTGASGAGNRSDSLNVLVIVFGFIGCNPFAVDRSKAAGIEHLIRLLIPYLEEIFPKISVVDSFPRIAGPGKRFKHDLVNAESFLRDIACVEIVETHGPWRYGKHAKVEAKASKTIAKMFFILLFPILIRIDIPVLHSDIAARKRTGFNS